MAGSPVSVTQTRSPDNPDLLDFALRALRAGLRPVPVRERIKAPALPSWKRYQNHVPQEAEVRTWFGKPRAGVGLIMGNGVECLDFDTDEAWEAFQQVAEAAGHEELLDHVASGYLEKTPRGWHVLYRCPEVAGNQKLAVVDGKAVIETRGTGGFVITAPSGGAVHPTGLSYVLQRGGVEGLRGIHPEERAVLFDLARQLSSEAPRPAEPFRPPPARELAGEGYRPGDDYNARTSWREILEPHGWVCVKQRGPEEFWRRPGKNKGHGATVNFQGNDLLWVFTTSTPFQNERSYDKFGAYAVLNHGGDHSEAARELAKQGYGDERAARPRLQPVDISALVRSNEEEREEIAPLPRKARFPEHLLRTDGLVGDFASYISDAAYLPQPILALGSALTVLGAVMGRQVQTPGGLRTNVFALGLGESGCGKEATRSLPRRALGEAGLAKLATTDDVTGDAAIHRALEDCPSCVFMLDEVGELMKSLANPRSGDYKRSQKTAFLRLYGTANSTYYGKTYAGRDKEPVKIEQPNLCIWGTSVPQSVWESMTSAEVVGGFLSRFLVFESEDPDPEPNRLTVEQQAPPAGLVRQLARWKVDEPLHIVDGYLGSLKPTTRTVPMDDAAIRLIRDLERDMKSRREALRRRGRDPGAFHRVHTAAEKLALIHACGRSFADSVIEARDMEWSVELATFLAERKAVHIEELLADSEEHAAMKVILAKIKAGAKGHAPGFLSASMVTRAYQKSRTVRRDALATLVGSEQALEVQVKNHKGQKATYFVIPTREAIEAFRAHGAEKGWRDLGELNASATVQGAA